MISMKEDLPSVSIIILNYNGKELIEDCLSSLAKLDYPRDRLEILMIDNGSSDDSIAYIEQCFPYVKNIKNPENYGFAKGCNIGAKNATGEYIALLNNDMRVEKKWLKELILPLMKDNKIGITTSKILNWDGTRIDFAGAALSFCGFGYKKGDGKEDYGYAKTEYCLFPSGGSMVISKDLFWKLHGFDDDYFAYFEDIDLGWRTWVYGYSVLFVPQSVVYHKISQTQKKANVKHIYLLEKNALCTIFKNYELKNVIPLFCASVLLLTYRMRLDKKAGKLDYFKERKAALRFFLRNIVKLLLKRYQIQKHRKYRDIDIFPYFKHPICSKAFDYAENKIYTDKFNKIVETFRIKNVFPDSVLEKD